MVPPWRQPTLLSRRTQTRMQTQIPAVLSRLQRPGALQSQGTACSRQASVTHNPAAGDQHSLAEKSLCAVPNRRLLKCDT